MCFHQFGTSSITVSEYVKSWMRDISELLWWKPTKTWSSKRFAVKKPTRRVRPQSSGRNFRPYKRRQIQPKARWSKQKRRSTRLECMMTIIAMKANHTDQDEVLMFDTDAKAIRIDNCAFYCISNDKRDFITPLKKANKKLKRLGGTLSEIYSGTIKWSIEDDDAVLHDIVIPNGLHVKESPSKLLSPQHWAQTAQDFKPLPRDTWCSTYHDCIQLHWNQRRFTKTVKLDVGGANIATLQQCTLLQVLRLSTLFALDSKWRWMRMILSLGTISISSQTTKTKTLNKFRRLKHQMPRNRAWIGANLRRHRSC
jgi:hypothetical protein